MPISIDTSDTTEYLGTKFNIGINNTAINKKVQKLLTS